MAIILTNAKIFDGTGSAAFLGEVRIDNDRITDVAKAPLVLSRVDSDQIIDCMGKFVMPGMVEAHAHLTWPTSIEKFVPGMYLPSEELALTAARNARILLDQGFTSAYSAGSLSKSLEVKLNEFFVSGGLPGPRFIPSSVEREPPNESDLDPGHIESHGMGPDAVRNFVKDCADLGAKAIKFLISGESALKPGASLELLYSEEELMAAGEEAKKHDVWLTGHAHAAEAVKLGIKSGFRILYHCTYADEECLDLLEQHKDEIFVAPTIGIIQATLDANPPPHMDMTHMKNEAQIVLDKLKELVPKLRQRGIRLLPGGDYGFPFNPNGRNAWDLELWMRHFGYTAEEALHAATELGGMLMGHAGELGMIREGCIADLLVIEGDPTQDIRIVQNKQNIKAIMQNGRFYKKLEG